MPKIKKLGGRLCFECPGCHELHCVTDAWTFNGDLERPTFSPSVLVRGTKPISDDEHARIMQGEKIQPVPFVCHSFVRDGKIQFLNDCTHDLAGQTVELPDVEDYG